MYVSMKETMNAALKGCYGIPAIAVENEHAVRAAIAAAEEKKSPIILIGMSHANPEICYHGRLIQDLAYRANVPVSMCLDHSATFEQAIWGIRAGYSDIMVDRSTLSYEDNVREVKELVRIAHVVNVGVEAELGHVGTGIDYNSEAGLTDPDEAVRFVEETGVDALAVAVGTAHGKYKGTPKIHFDLLEKLKSKLSVPMVLHGGSGTGDENLSKACKLGICKINVSNDLKKAMVDHLNAQDLTSWGLYRMYEFMAEAFKKKVIEYLDICGCAGKAPELMQSMSEQGRHRSLWSTTEKRSAGE
jgi:fructose-bisphosphate aldolase class II